MNIVQQATNKVVNCEWIVITNNCATLIYNGYQFARRDYMKHMLGSMNNLFGFLGLRFQCATQMMAELWGPLKQKIKSLLRVMHEQFTKLLLEQDESIKKMIGARDVVQDTGDKWEAFWMEVLTAVDAGDLTPLIKAFLDQDQ